MYNNLDLHNVMYIADNADPDPSSPFFRLLSIVHVCLLTFLLPMYKLCACQAPFSKLLFICFTLSEHLCFICKTCYFGSIIHIVKIVKTFTMKMHFLFLNLCFHFYFRPYTVLQYLCSNCCVLGFYVLPTTKVIWRRGLDLKSHPKDWRSPGSNLPPWFTRRTPWKLLLCSKVGHYMNTMSMFSMAY